MRCIKRIIGSIDFQTGCKVQEKIGIARSGDIDYGMRSVSVPRLDAFVHKALLPKFSPPMGPNYMDYQLACQQDGGAISATRMLFTAFTSAGC